MLETERLILSTWRDEDWVGLRPIATDPEVMRYITGGVAWTDEQIRNFVERQLKAFADRGFCRWRLIDKATGTFIGFCGAGFFRDVPIPEIGWWLSREQWGKGLATEAARVALRDVFERVGLERVVSIANPGNTASRGIMHKIGLTFECEFENAGDRLVRYTMSRNEYLAKAATAQ